MKLAVRLFLLAIAVPTIFLVHFYGMFLVAALLPSYEAAFDWPILGFAILSFITTTTLAIAFIFRDQKQ
ncbi:hypothetical protein C0V72_08170 [Porphyrobacter sp. TH134]|uniref:hypothetical protein n=1 Tax=Porphyrobacter sp. TH134 TaxID=2067450 RepID=UPI000C7DD3D6|nr:hypothetical protein [Porphyrobacter sp. TH134]PLK23720.1 hypothetical protein C0V72_08170 [Porphyrobacter sp. TH134]